MTAGTAVSPATRVLYGLGNIQPNYNVNVIEAATGTRAQQVDGHVRAVAVAGQITHPLGADEIIEWLLMSVNAGVTPTTQSSPTPTVDPTVSVAGTDGTLPAGVYTVAYTITTPAGESQKKTVTATATITGAHEHIVVGAVTPLAAGATLVTYYVSTAGGGTATVTKTATNATGASINLLNPGDGTTIPPTATPTAVQTWVFTPGTTLDSATLEWEDGYQNWQAAGVRVNQWKLTGNPGEQGNNQMQVDLFGTAQIVNAQTPALTARVPNYMEGWEAKLYLDPFGGTAGATNIAHTMTAWDVTFGNNLARKYFGDNVKNTGAVVIGKLAAMMDVTLEANASGLAEFNNHVAGTKRLIRLEFGNNLAIGTGTANYKVSIDMPCVWSAKDISGVDAGTRVYKLTAQYINDVTNAFPFRVTVVNSRSAAYA